jgi:hypothetical protein
VVGNTNIRNRILHIEQFLFLHTVNGFVNIYVLLCTWCTTSWKHDFDDMTNISNGCCVFSFYNQQISKSAFLCAVYCFRLSLFEPCPGGVATTGGMEEVTVEEAMVMVEEGGGRVEEAGVMDGDLALGVAAAAAAGAVMVLQSW